MSSLKEKIADFFFRNHKIEDKLGNEPHLEESMLGKLQNTVINVRAKTAALGISLATCFNMFAGLEDSMLTEVAICAVGFAGYCEWHSRYLGRRSSSPEYYVDTAPQGEVTYPNDDSVMNTIWENYHKCSPERTAFRELPLFGGVAAISYLLGGAEYIPLMAAGAAVACAEDSQAYWQARQVLHENWQVYTTKPERQTRRSKQPEKSAPAPNA